MHDTLTPEDLRFTPPDLDERVVRTFVEAHWGKAGTYKRLSGERDQNFRLAAAEGQALVVKIASPVEDPALVDYQVQALRHIAASDPDLAVPRLHVSLAGNNVETLIHEGAPHAVRLLSFVPGVPLQQFDTLSLEAVRQVGRLQARLCRALQGFSHPADTHFMPWDALNGLVVSPALRHGYLPPDLERVCAPHLQRLESVSLPRMREFPVQVIHNDGHRGNVMCDPEDPSRVTGVIDFGDLARRPIVTDLATSLTSFIGHSDRPLLIAATLLGGFREIMPVPDGQVELLYDAILTRAILTVQLLTYRVKHTDVPKSVGDIDLIESIVNLQTMLAIDPAQFLETVTS